MMKSFTPRLVLRTEGLAVLAMSMFIYARLGHGWILFAVTFLLPDISIAAYLVNNKIGALCYNTAHSYVIPLAMAFILWRSPDQLWAPLVWCAHIGMDRSLGFGLKYDDSFKSTHLQRV
jgi:hypothetical protein